jgi:hypothetical protein
MVEHYDNATTFGYVPMSLNIQEDYPADTPVGHDFEVQVNSIKARVTVSDNQLSNGYACGLLPVPEIPRGKPQTRTVSLAKVAC